MSLIESIATLRAGEPAVGAVACVCGSFGASRRACRV